MNNFSKLFAASAIVIWSALLSLSGFANSSSAGVIAQHLGAADPTDEGWAKSERTTFGGPAISTYPVLNDLGTDIDAWAIDDDSSRSQGGYRIELTPQENEAARNRGWVLSARLRVVDAPLDEPTNQFTIAQVMVSDDQYNTFGISVSMERDGSPLVNVGPEERPEIVDLDDLDSGYHMYELQFDPTTHRAALFVDEIIRATDIRSFINRPFVSSVYFGSTYAAGFGHANYNLVKYEITAIPEPSTVWLIALAAVALSGVGRSRYAAHTTRARQVVKQNPIPDASILLAVALGTAFICSVSTVQAQATLEWVRHYDGGSYDVADDVAIDGAGNVFATGVSWPVDNDRWPDGIDRFVSKYGANGGLEWTQRMGIQNFGQFDNPLDVDRLGNAYLTAETAADSSTISAYAAEGVLQWTEQFGTGSAQSTKGVATDGLGNVYVSGSTSGSLYGSNTGESDAFLSKYDASGTLQWGRQFGGDLRDIASAVATDESGNAYVAGGMDDDPDVLGVNGNAFLAKYDPNGVQQWMQQLAGGVGKVATSVSVDGLGNIYIAGTTFGDFGDYDLDPFVAKYDATGALQWHRQEDLPEPKLADAVSADGLGNVYVAGHIANDTGVAYFSKFDGSGSLQWSEQFGFGNSTAAKGIAADGLGNVYVCGATARDDIYSTNAFVAKFVDPQTIPEPASVWLIALATLTLAGLQRSVCGKPGTGVR